MKIQIDDNIIKKTTDCDKQFRCLADENHVYCAVELCLDEKVHFIKCVEGRACKYALSFGYSHLCTCPVRKEIYNRYHK